jgi:hypothetical protein
MVTLSAEVSVLSDVIEALSCCRDQLVHLRVYICRPAEHEGRNYRSVYNKVVPESIGLLKNLQSLRLLGCGSLVSFAERTAGMSRLEVLELEGSARLFCFSSYVDAWPALRALRIWGQQLQLRSLTGSVEMWGRMEESCI